MIGVQYAVTGGSCLLVGILLLRLTAGRYLPRHLFPALWCLAAVRLLLPVALPSPVSIWNLFRPSASAEMPAAAQKLTIFPAVQSATAAAAAQPTAHRIPVLAWIWAAGTLLLAVYILIGYLRMVRRFSSAAPAVELDAAQLRKKFGLLRVPRIAYTRDARAPLTYGIFRPVVLLPEMFPGGEEAQLYILTHELVHIRRGDCLRKALLSVCLCLYWWNPLCWAMMILAGRDMELACDEQVLRRLGYAQRRGYAAALLAAAAQQARVSPLCGGFGRPAAEERIRAIMKAKKIPVYLTIAAISTAAALVTAFATQAVPNGNYSRRADADLQQESPAILLEIPQTAPIEPIEELQTPQAPEEPDTSHEDAARSDAEDMDAAGQTAAYVFPLEDADAPVTDGYGEREVPIATKNGQTKTAFHRGVDLAAEEGSAVLAVAAGTVTVSTYDVAYGYMVTILHENGVQTSYCHLQQCLAAEGEIVQQGQVIGLTGASGWAVGPHLHLDVLVDGQYVDPLQTLAS